MKTLTICLLTYKRTDYARVAVSSVLGKLRFDGKLRFHIADDGSGIEHVTQLLSDINAINPDLPVTLSNSERRGYGANYNLATQCVHDWSDYVLWLEDDWELIRTLDASRVVDALDVLGGGCVRLGYIGYTQELRATFVRAKDSHWLRLHADSPEPHVFAGHPRIESVEWSKIAGEWPEGLQPGATEFRVSHNPTSRYRVYWPLPLIDENGNGPFVHIGTVRSY